jgi:hypothetical protein
MEELLLVYKNKKSELEKEIRKIPRNRRLPTNPHFVRLQTQMRCYNRFIKSIKQNESVLVEKNKNLTPILSDGERL